MMNLSNQTIREISIGHVDEQCCFHISIDIYDKMYRYIYTILLYDIKEPLTKQLSDKYNE